MEKEKLCLFIQVVLYLKESTFKKEVKTFDLHPFLRFELLHVLNFDSVRRRMSVIVKSVSGEMSSGHTNVHARALFEIRCWTVPAVCSQYVWLSASACVLRRVPAVLQRCRFIYFSSSSIRKGGASEIPRGAERCSE